MKYAYPLVGRTGLCNMLFPWARAVVYCKKTGARMIAPKWTSFLRIGPWLRGERDKRYYMQSFTNDGYLSRWFGVRTNRLACNFWNIKVFSGMAGFFNDIIESHGDIVKELRRVVNPSIVRSSDCLGKEDYIGVHVRRGDFVAIGQCVSDDWYISAIKQAREIVGDLPIYLFSDGDVSSLKERLSQVNFKVVIMPPQHAIMDLLILSHSKCVVATSRSTFSMWAVYLGQMPSIWSAVEQPPRLYVGEDLSMVI